MKVEVRWQRQLLLLWLFVDQSWYETYALVGRERLNGRKLRNLNCKSFGTFKCKASHHPEPSVITNWSEKSSLTYLFPACTDCSYRNRCFKKLKIMWKKSGKQKRRYKRNIQRSASVTYNSTFGEEIGHQYIFCRGVVEKKKAVHKSRIQTQRQTWRSMTQWKKEVKSIRKTLL